MTSARPPSGPFHFQSRLFAPLVLIFLPFLSLVGRLCFVVSDLFPLFLLARILPCGVGLCCSVLYSFPLSCFPRSCVALFRLLFRFLGTPH